MVITWLGRDFFRRLVSRSLVQLFASQLQRACRPWQYALSTRAGAEAVVKALVANTELDPDQNIVSVDGVGAYDHVSRTSMLTGLLQVPVLAFCPTVLCQPILLRVARPNRDTFHHPPSRRGRTRRSHDAALAAIQQQLHPNEALYAFLDDAHLVVPSQQVGDVLRIVQHQLSTHAHVHLHHGKARVWNAAGRAPAFPPRMRPGQLGRQPGTATSQPRASSLRRPSRQSRIHPTPAPDHP